MSGAGVFLGVSYVALSSGAGLLTCQKFLGTFYMRAHSMSIRNQLSYSAQTILEKNFCRVNISHATYPDQKVL